MTEETAGTPRTDEMEFGTEVLDSETVVRVVASEFARQLEREVAALTAERARDKVTHDLDLHGKMLEAATKQLREANARAEAAEAELDAAKRALAETIERCARVCEQQITNEVKHGRLQAESVLTRCAAAIRKEKLK